LWNEPEDKRKLVAVVNELYVKGDLCPSRLK
jgi:hypothetical protein